MQTSGGQISFASTTIAPGAVEAGFVSYDTTYPGPLTGNGNTIIKTGPADLILDSPGSDLAGATFDVQQGRLIAYHGSNPVEGATLQLSGGEIVLSAKPGTASPIDYDNPVVVETNGTLSVGPGDAGEPGPMTVNLGSSPENGLEVNNGSVLTINAVDQYSLNVAGPLGGDGSVNLDGGVAVNLAAGGQIANVNVLEGSLTLGADLDVDAASVFSVGTIDTGGNRLNVADSALLGGTTFVSDESNSFAVVGSDLGNNDAPKQITLTGGTLQLIR